MEILLFIPQENNILLLMLFLKRGQGRKRVCVTFNQKQRISRVFLHEVEMHLHIFDTFQK